MNINDIRSKISEAVEEIRKADLEQKLEEMRIKYLGRKGLIQDIMAELKNIDASLRSEFGKAANEFKVRVTDALNSKISELKSGKSAGSSVFDYSRPGDWRGLGAKHPVSYIISETVRILGRLGFTVAEGPDIESKHHNFTALNTPDHHPSLDNKDTFWFETGECLRTQTSPVQIRVMEQTKPPVRIITPGRCYRRDTTDATHSANFHQIEGLYVDRKVSLADLKGTLEFFANEMMGSGVKVRFRPHFFPFTEPSVEVDFSCHVCGGKGCRVCKMSGWIEIAGAGMVDPRVFKHVGYDSELYTGYAFGMGIERIAMIKFGVNDIRMFYENDTRFLEQFL